MAHKLKAADSWIRHFLNLSKKIINMWMYRVHTHRPYKGIELKNNLGRKEPLREWAGDRDGDVSNCNMGLFWVHCFGASLPGKVVIAGAKCTKQFRNTAQHKTARIYAQQQKGQYSNDTTIRLNTTSDKWKADKEQKRFFLTTIKDQANKWQP